MGTIQNESGQRRELFELFQPLDWETALHWASVFKSRFSLISEHFRKIADRYPYLQEEVTEQFILWRDPENKSVECMFYFVNDVADLSAIYHCFEYIKQFDVYLTYIIAHQKCEGENVFDIFRSSRFSVLEHCGRVIYPIEKQ